MFINKLLKKRSDGYGITIVDREEAVKLNKPKIKRLLDSRKLSVTETSVKLDIKSEDQVQSLKIEVNVQFE